MTARVLLIQGMFDRWYVAKADDSSLYWSGSRWVEVYDNVAISNFSTAHGAFEYAKSFGFKVVEVRW